MLENVKEFVKKNVDRIFFLMLTGFFKQHVELLFVLLQIYQKQCLLTCSTYNKHVICNNS